MSEIYFKHPGLGGRRVVIQGFKLDDGKIRCELCSKPCQPHELGTLTITYKDTGKTETHKVCLECGKKLDEGYARTLQTMQLTKAKELLKKLLSAYTSYADSFDDRDNEIIAETEQFLSEVEK